jgi:hypothetical protein
MLQKILTELKDYVLEKNNYLLQGYSNVYTDEQTGVVHEDKAIFPADNMGNYCYLRMAGALSFDYDKVYNLSDTINGVGLKAQVNLVASVKDADNGKLLANMVNTIRAYQKYHVRLTTALCQPEAVIMQELAKINRNLLLGALQRTKHDDALVSVSFIVTIPFQFIPTDCLTNPCKIC